MEIEDYLNEAIASFERDEPDSEYQEGYEAALLELRNVFFPQKN